MQEGLAQEEGFAGFKAWLTKKANNYDSISFVDESPFTHYSSNTWRIDFGASLHVTNSSQGLLMTWTIAGGGWVEH